jgi:hypothetical protein
MIREDLTATGLEMFGGYMNAMRELPPMEIKDECQECHGVGRKYFNTMLDLVDYLRIKYTPFKEARSAIKQFEDEKDFITCPECSGKGFKTIKL